VGDTSLSDATAVLYSVYNIGKVFRIGTVRYNWPMSAHASQAFSIAHCTDSEELPNINNRYTVLWPNGREGIEG